jgi:hypothetical protein
MQSDKPEVDEVNLHTHFQQFRPSIKEVIATKHFLKEAADFNPEWILDSQHQYFTILHKLEETIQGNHIFRALHNGKHIVYAIDKKHRLILLKTFNNFKHYLKYLDNKKTILKTIENTK